MKENIESEKVEILRGQGALYKDAKKISDDLFKESDFFDPYDLVQVKYEMLRRVQEKKDTVSSTCKAYGFSRRAFYDIQTAFKKEGILGLLPQKKGPKKRHKLDAHVMAFVKLQLEDEPSLKSTTLAKRVEEQFNITIHPRSIERALVAQKKSE